MQNTPQRTKKLKAGINTKKTWQRGQKNGRRIC